MLDLCEWYVERSMCATTIWKHVQMGVFFAHTGDDFIDETPLAIVPGRCSFLKACSKAMGATEDPRLGAPSMQIASIVPNLSTA